MNIMKITLLLLALPPLSQAAPICEPLENLTQRVNYCDENPTYVEPAKACLQSYKALVDAENARIQSVLNRDVNNASGTQQEVDFQTTQKVLASADATLTSLISQGRQVQTEFNAMTDDFVLPIYEAYPEDYDIDPYSRHGQTVFREKECCGEPMEDFDGMKAELRKILSDLEKTKAKTVALHKTSSFKEANLDSVNPATTGTKNVGNGGRVPSSIRGKSKNKGSSITGVEENKAKQKKVP